MTRKRWQAWPRGHVHFGAWRATSGALSCLVALTAFSALASAEALPEAIVSTTPPAAPYHIDIAYSAPASCPQAGAFLQALAEKLDSDTTPPLPSRVSITADGALHALQIESSAAGKGGFLSERDTSCHYLVERAATAIALARVTPVSAALALASAPLDGGGTASVVRSDGQTPPQTPRQPLTGKDRGADPPDEQPQEPRPLPPWEISVGAAAVYSSGMLPEPAVGGAGQLGLELRDLAFRVSAYWLPAQTEYRSSSEGTPPLPLRLGARGIEGHLCSRHGGWGFDLGNVFLELCGNLSGHRVTSEAPSFGAANANADWIGYGLSVGVSARMASTQLSLHFGARSPFYEAAVRRPPFREALHAEDQVQSWMQFSISGLTLGASNSDGPKPETL